MDHTAPLARHFARLVGLLVTDPAQIDEQKAALRALVMLLRDGGVELTRSDAGLAADGTLIANAVTGVPELRRGMQAHGLASVRIDRAATPGDLLGSARILAAATGAGSAASGVAQLEALGATTVHFIANPHDAITPAGLPELGFGDVLEEIDVTPARPTPRATMAIPSGDSGAGHRGGLFEQFAAARAPTGTHEELLHLLDTTLDVSVMTRTLDDLVTLADQAAADGRSSVISDILWRVGGREGLATDSDARRVIGLALRRLARPSLLRAVVTQLPHRPEERDRLVTIITRAGEDGVDVLVEQIGTVAGHTDRRVYFDVLLLLQSGVPTLLHMLGDSRWFVARNAADLLGEMQAREAEVPLTDLLKHEDERVRRSATAALMRLGTPRAMQAIQEGLRDPIPQLRMEAAAALVTRKDVRSASTLLRALDVERDDEVQAAFMVALGRLATVESVQRLLRVAEPERGLFRKKTTAVRVGAVQGLAEARTDEAMEMLRSLEADRDADVREAAVFALGRIARLTAP